MNENLHAQHDPARRAEDLSYLTIRDLLAELTRLEDRLNSRRAAGNYHANPEIARIERQMRTIRTELRRRSNQRARDSVPPTDVNEADRLEQSIPVETGPDEDYPHQQEIDRS